MTDPIEKRLDLFEQRHSEAQLRLEGKIDKISDALLTLVRVEERVGTISGRIDGMDSRLSVHSKRIDDIDGKVESMALSGALSRGKLGVYERLVWMVGASVVSGAVGVSVFFITKG